MKLSVQLNKGLEEPSVLVEYAEVNREVETILAALSGLGTELVGRNYRVAGLRPFPNARLQLLMDNGEYVIASRQFAPMVKKKLGL